MLILLHNTADPRLCLGAYSDVILMTCFEITQLAFV